MQLIVALAIVLLLLLLAAWYLFSGGGVAGALPGGGTPARPLDRWVTSPAQIQVGVNATFVFESMNNNPLAIGTQLTPITGRAVGFTTAPSEISIVSINATAVGAAVGAGTSGATGTITVVIVASGVPAALPGEDAGQGALIGIPVADTSVREVANFTVVP